MTNSAIPLLLITKDPSHPLSHLALRYARALLEQDTFDLAKHNTAGKMSDIQINKDEKDLQPLNLFFYADAAHVANRLRWQSADQLNLTKEWQALAEFHQLTLPVCVSTALSRGISDKDNSQRHHLNGDNIAAGFSLVGLSELAMMMQSNCRLIQF